LGQQRYQEVYDEQWPSGMTHILGSFAARLRYTVRQPFHDKSRNRGINMMPVVQKGTGEPIKHRKIVSDTDIPLTIAAGRLLSLNRDKAANHIVRLACTWRSIDHLVAVTAVGVQAVHGQSLRSGLRLAFEQVTVDRLQPAGHVCCHYALRQLEEKQAPRGRGDVELIFQGGAVALKAWPGEVEVDAFARSRVTLLW